VWDLRNATPNSAESRCPTVSQIHVRIRIVGFTGFNGTDSFLTAGREIYRSRQFLTDPYMMDEARVMLTIRSTADTVL
jgi:hypothetical protein